GKYLTKVFYLAAAIFCLHVQAGEKVDRSLEVKPDGHIEIHNVRGEITITGWDKPEVKVKGTLDDLTEKFIFEERSGHTVIKVELPDNTSLRSGEGSNLEIWLPQSASVDFNGVATDLKVTRVKGKLEVNTVSGDLRLEDLGKDLYVNSVSGDVELKGAHGRIEMQTVSGDIVARVSAEQINVNGVSADVTITNDVLSQGKLSTVSGDIKITSGLKNDANLEINTVSGDGIWYVVGDVSARISMETAPGGTVINEL
ncbi:MAG: hypothetical protein CUN57_00460, partial [Phototrophicales bacterium]